MPKHTVTIDVLGCSLPISAEEEPDYLKNLLETFKRKITEIQKKTGLQDSLKIAVLTGFLLCDELEKTRREKTTEKNNELPADESEAEQLTLNLISRLGDILGISEKSNGNAANTGSEVFKLKNTVKNYDWGSPRMIQELVGESETDTPWAELWMGVHPEGPSKFVVENSDNGIPAEILLPELIAKNPEFFLSEKAKTFDTLPFLFKILAAEKPLSIQAHPNLEQAREGWARENREGIPKNSPGRNYRDANHKPEIICALSDFTAMAGFRQPEEIKEKLSAFLEGASRELKVAFFPLFNTLDEKTAPLKSFLAALFALSSGTRKALNAYAVQQQNDETAKLIAAFAELFPADPAIISPLYLNVITLKAGEALYIPAGVLHAYVHGIGVELMANSDNVLRGGMTPKHIDQKELFRVLEFKPFTPHIMKAPDEAVFTYPAYCDEFSLSVLKGGEIPYPETGPSIVLVTEGRVKISGSQNETILVKGESAFLPAGSGGLTLSGNFTLYLAGTGPA